MNLNSLIVTAALVAATNASASPNFSEEMRAISVIESSSGKNFNHRKLVTGPHKGTRAGGSYGLMPSSVRYIIRVTPALTVKYGYWLTASAADITAELNANRTFDDELATALWARLRRWYKVEVAAYAWYNGWRRASEADLSDIAENGYVVRFRRAYSSVRHSQFSRRQ